MYEHRRCESVGICGVIRRDSLPGPDLGFAFLERFQGQGLALEAARAVMRHASKHLFVQRMLAVTSPENIPSLRLLEKLGFKPQQRLALAPDGAESLLFVHESGANP